jgi:response regulator RpfG family c-di-GMP phosphodiesterase
VASGQKGQFLKKVIIPLETGIAGWVARTWKPLVVNDVTKDERFTGQVDKQSGFRTRSILAVPMILSGELIGVCEVVNKRTGPFTDQDLATLANLSGLAAVAILNARLVQDQKNFFSNMFEVLTCAVESQNSKFVGHSSRVAELACAVGKSLNLSEENYRNLYYGALLHHVGVIVLNNDMILLRAGVSSQDIAREHLYPVLGAQLLCGIKLLSGAIPLVRHHREYYDGTGFPDKLKKDDIPLGARIICLAEHVEILRMWGLRGPELTVQSIRMAREGSGTRFDPEVVRAFAELTEKAIQLPS